MKFELEMERWVRFGEIRKQIPAKRPKQKARGTTEQGTLKSLSVGWTRAFGK